VGKGEGVRKRVGMRENGEVRGYEEGGKMLGRFI
jgi:hypothetical protein